MREVSEIFKECMRDYFIPPEAKAVEPVIPWCPMPGGALTANTQMLRDNDIMEKYPEIIAAMGEVVARGGFGTSVTPVSQFYFQQAFNNVMFGPWKKIAPTYGQMVLGYFGKTPVKPDPEIVKLASEQLGLEPTTQPPIERNNADPEKGLGPARKIVQAEGFEETDENIFIVATCKEKGVKFLKGEGEVGVRKIDPGTPAVATDASSDSGAYTVTVDGKAYAVQLDGGQATVDGQTFSVNLQAGTAAGGAVATGGAAATATGTEVTSKMPGSVFKILVPNGARVKEGDTILVLEAMKMESPVAATANGTVEHNVSEGQQVKAGDVLSVIR